MMIISMSEIVKSNFPKDDSTKDSSRTPKFLICLSDNLPLPIPVSTRIFLPSICNKIGSVRNSIKLLSLDGYLLLHKAFGTTPNIAPPSKKLTPPRNHVNVARPTFSCSIRSEEHTSELQ